MSLALNELYKSFGGNQVIDGVTLEIEDGKVTSLVGPNGAGKTTLFNLVTGFVAVDRGTIRFAGRNLGGLSPQAVKRHGLVRTFQNLRLFLDMTVLENVRVALESDLSMNFWSRRNLAQVEKVLRRVSLWDQRQKMAGELSYAERKFLSLARVLLGVQHLVRKLLLGQQRGQQLGVLDRGGADQDRLPSLVAIAYVAGDRVVLLPGGAVHEIQAVLPDHRLVGGNDHRLELVDVLEFERFGVRRTGHPGKLAVEAEIVLEGDRGERLVLVLDLDLFLGLDRLVNAVGPAAPHHQPPGELVDDDHLPVLHHVVLVAQVKVMCPQRRVELMHEIDVGRLIQARALGQQADSRQNLLGSGVT